MRLVHIPLLAALVGAPTLSPYLAAAEGEVTPQVEDEVTPVAESDVPLNAEGHNTAVPGDAQAQRQEAQRQEAQRRREAGEAAAEDERSGTPGDAQTRRRNAQRQRDEAKRRSENGEPEVDDERNGEPGDAQTRRQEAQRKRDEAQRRREGSEAETAATSEDDQHQREETQRRRESGKTTADEKRETMLNSPAAKAQLQERAARLKTKRPELFRRLDVDNNGELSPEELRRHRKQFNQRNPARQEAGDQKGPGSRSNQSKRPAKAEGDRALPPAAANDEAVADFLFGE